MAVILQLEKQNLLPPEEQNIGRVFLDMVMPMKVYITYFTMARDIDGELKTFSDLYGRDAPVLASFEAPRVGNRARVTSEEVIEIVDDLQTS